MKSLHPYSHLAVLLVALSILTAGCSKKLIEHPHTVFTVDYFKSPSGLQSAVNALYSGLRFDYGPEGAVGIQVDGTDEFTYGDQPRTGAGGTADYLTLGNYTLDASNGAILTPWNRNYSNINLANEVIAFAPEVNMDTTAKVQIIAQARFLRGLYYLLLTEQFGAVPVDLGGGYLKPNTKAFQGFNRLPTDSVLILDYQAMIDDFTYATQNLKDRRPDGAFYADKAAALTKLAQVYLFRGYSAAKQPNDFKDALSAAMQVVSDTAQYGTKLLEDFGEVSIPGNDYNPEIIFSVERVPGNFNANEVGSPDGIGGGKGVDATNDFTPDYTSIPVDGINGSGTKAAGSRSILYGRPIRRFCPTAWLYNVLFADKEIDSRFDNSFRMMWYSTNSDATTNTGDTAFVLAKTKDEYDSLIGLNRPYGVVAPKDFYIIGGGTAYNIYPQLKKYDDPNKGAANNEGTRPFPVIKLSDTYLLAAEAAYQTGDAATAAKLLTTLRQRAAYRPGLNDATLTTRRNAMKVTSAQVTLDFILDERARELCGESMRWSDLAMRHDESGTNELLKRVKAFNPDAAAIKSFMTLRPVPQSQLDASAAIQATDKAKYQNPGY